MMNRESTSSSSSSGSSVGGVSGSSAAGEADKFLYFDPKVVKSKGAIPPSSRSRQATPFRDAIVFVVGGGCYNEIGPKNKMVQVVQVL